MPAIIYLHGFRSAPQSAKATQLKARMAARGLADRFWCEQLPVGASDVLSLVESAIARFDAPTLVGSSLGGYYATWLAERHGLRAVLINPAVIAPLSLAQYIGPQTNLYSGETFEFTAAHVDQLRRIEVPEIADPTRYWLLAETGDELLDYRHAVAKYAGARQTVLDGGDHSFTRWADYLDPVIDFAGL